MARSLGFSGDGINFQIAFGQSFWLKCPSWWCAQCSAKMDPSERDSGMWSDTVVSPFDLSWTLLVGGGLFVPFPLLGPPVVKHLMPIVTMVPGQGGQFRCASLTNGQCQWCHYFILFSFSVHHKSILYTSIKKKFFFGHAMQHAGS